MDGLEKLFKIADWTGETQQMAHNHFDPDGSILDPLPFTNKFLMLTWCKKKSQERSTIN